MKHFEIQKVEEAVKRQADVKIKGLYFNILFFLLFVILGIVLHQNFADSYGLTLNEKLPNLYVWWLIFHCIVGFVWLCNIMMNTIPEIWQLKMNREYWILQNKKGLIEEIYKNIDIEGE